MWLLFCLFFGCEELAGPLWLCVQVRSVEWNFVWRELDLQSDACFLTQDGTGCKTMHAMVDDC